MPNPPSDSSWDADDVMPPLAKSAKEPENSATTPAPAFDPDAAFPTARQHPSPDTSIRSIVEENRAITDASIKLRRGQTSEARADVLTIIEVRPRSAAAYELLGDIESAVGNLDSANAAYRKAMSIEPGRATAETKLARAALRQTEEARQSLLSAALAQNSPTAAVPGSMPTTASPTISGNMGVKSRLPAIIASMILPGLGQMIKGEYVKGGIILIVTLIATGMFVSGFNAAGLESLLRQDVASAMDASRAVPPAPKISGMTWLGMILTTGAWLYSLIDSALPRDTRLRTPD
jgi:hypothetical protein